MKNFWIPRGMKVYLMVWEPSCIMHNRVNIKYSNSYINILGGMEREKACFISRRYQETQI